MKKYELSQNAGMVRASDLSREMTLRNASENRRLVGHLQHLDLQLRNNLVNLQAEIAEMKLSHCRQRPKTSYPLGKTPVGKSWSDPRYASERQMRSQSPGISPLAVQGSSSELSSKPFLPQISTRHTPLVGKRMDSVETPHPPRSPKSARRQRNAPKLITSHLSTSTSTNLYRPKSSPNLRAISPPEDSNSDTTTCQPFPVEEASGINTLVEKDGPQSLSSGDLRVTPLELHDRVSDFLKRPNTSSCKREKAETRELKRTSNDVIPTINIEQEELEEVGETGASNAENTNDENQTFVTDEELFRNSLLLKASRDDGFSSSMPDLSSLGFMDFNEVIDQRLRKVKEEIPSEKEMRKLRYLRFRDEPAPLPIKEIFEKENHQEHLDKIDEWYGMFL